MSVTFSAMPSETQCIRIKLYILSLKDFKPKQQIKERYKTWLYRWEHFYPITQATRGCYPPQSRGSSGQQAVQSVWMAGLQLSARHYQPSLTTTLLSWAKKPCNTLSVHLSPHCCNSSRDTTSDIWSEAVDLEQSMTIYTTSLIVSHDL